MRIHGQKEQPADLRQRGYSKDVSGVERQFAVGLVQTSEGFPLAHEVFKGNIGEKSTVRGIVTRLCRRFPIRRLIFVADRGMLSLDNLSELEELTVASEHPVEYIVAVPARRYQRLSEPLAELHRELVEASRHGAAEVIRETRSADGRRLVVTYNARSAQQTRRLRAKHLRKVLHLARHLEQRLDAQDRGEGGGRGRRLSEGGAKERLYRAVLEQQVGAWITVHLSEPGYSWSWNVEAFKRELLWDGKLVLISNVETLEAGTLIQRYKELADIERGFRVLKSQLEIAPVYHRLADRIRAHTLICFLALVIQRLLRYRLRAQATDLSPATALEQLREVQYHRVRFANGQCLASITRLTPQLRHVFALLDVEVPTTQLIEGV